MMDPLPRCLHGNCLLDAADERLEPPCGCRYGFAIIESKLTCKWCKRPIYEGVPEGRRRTFAHIETKVATCSLGALSARGRAKRHIAYPEEPKQTTAFENDPNAGGS